MTEAVFGPLVTLACTVLFGWMLVQGFRKGTMEFQQPAITFAGRRMDQPVRFWLIAGFLTFLTVGSAIATIGQVFSP